MIIEVKQTCANLRQEFEIYYNKNFAYYGKLGSLHPMQDILLYDAEKTVAEGRFRFSRWINYIPFRYLFGSAALKRYFEITYKNEKTAFFLSRQGFFKSFYVISTGDKGFRAYSRSIGEFHYVSIYKVDAEGNEEQIALVETLLSTQNNRYNHKVYLRDSYDKYKDIMAMFILYYSNYCFAHRLEVYVGSTTVRQWSYSPYNKKYNSSWREENFPDENFWGSASLLK